MGVVEPQGLSFPFGLIFTVSVESEVKILIVEISFRESPTQIGPAFFPRGTLGMWSRSRLLAHAG